ncbi:MAG: ATP-binding protein [Candidatus Thorarchaeota archaeon]
MSNYKKEKEKSIKESDEKLKLFLENAYDLIIIINLELKIEYVNKKPLYKLTRYDVEEVIGKIFLEFLHPEDRKVILELFSKAFKEEGEATLEARLKHKDGHYLYIETNGKLFHNEKGKPKALLITRDITELKNFEKFVTEENKKLKEVNQIKSELIMQSSHEFKTPLSSIYAASQLLLNNIKDQVNIKSSELIEIIYKESQRLKHLIENLLDVSRVESGKFSLQLKKENLIKIIKSCYADLKYWADKKNLKFTFDLPSDLILKVDKLRIEQVITNLISNAIKYTPLRGNIYISLKEKDTCLEFSIKDTGIGFTKNETKLLFQKFGKIKRLINRMDIDTEGSGLGLYISKEIVELHNGKISAKSLGRYKGSTFTIRLPKST